MRSLGLFTPYPLDPGGGERYLLSIAEAVRGDLDVYLITPTEQSPERLALLGRALDLQVDHINLIKQEKAIARSPFDLSVVMGNEALPPILGLALKNYFLCQFPFRTEPLELARRTSFWPDYESVVV